MLSYGIKNVHADELGRLIKLSHVKRIEQGIHATQMSWICEHCSKEGKNKLTYYAWHGVRCLANPNITQEHLNRRSDTKKKQSSISKKTHEKLVSENKFNRKKSWKCEHCLKEGTNISNFNKYHGSNCLSNPNISVETKIQREAWSKNNSIAQIKSVQDKKVILN